MAKASKRTTQKPKLGPTIQSPADTTDPNAYGDHGKSAFGAQAGPPFSGFPRTTRARKRNSF